MINDLKNRFGGKCSGININGIAQDINQTSVKMKLCEAVKYSFDIPIQVNNENLGCPGARRSIGFDSDNLKLAKTISNNNDIPLSHVKNILKEIPAIKTEIGRVNFGIKQEMEEYLPPDLFIMYVYPSEITKIMHLLTKHMLEPSIPPYALLSICGNVFANSYINKLISISFGCPESRKYGGVEDNEVVVGIPFQFAKYLTA